MPLQFDTTIKAGDILTSITIALSVIALVFSLAKDRASRVTDQANRVRTAAASTLAKLDRWQGVQLSMYQELQPEFIELSEDLAKQHDVIVVRDKFWKLVSQERARVAKQVLDEQLGTAYADLLTHFPLAREKVVAAFFELSGVENQTSAEFLEIGQRGILSLKDKQKEYQTAELGNILRESAAKGSERLSRDSEKVLAPVRSYLLRLVAMPDDELVNVVRPVAQQRSE